MRGYVRVARRRLLALRDHARAWPGPAWSWVRKFVANWWTEIRAFCLPLVIVFLAICSPDIGLPVSLDASIGAVAAVQAAVTGLSLIALVLAVELARRQEDRDDTVYEIMLRSAWIRPTFLFAIAALLATLTAIAIGDFSVAGDATQSANLLLSAYVLTGAVGIALLWTVLRTVQGLKPTGIIEFRFTVNDAKRRERVEEFISRTRNDYPAMDPVQRAILPFAPVALTALERLMFEVDDALQSQEAGRFSGALNRLQWLISNSADQIVESGLGFQPPGPPRHGYWFPLDAVNDHLPELWRAAFDRPGFGFVEEMWSLQYFLIVEGIKRRSGELLEVGLRSGLAAYSAAAQVDRHEDHALHEWVNIDGMWHWLRRYDGDHSDRMTIQIGARLVEHLHEYGNVLLVADDAASFGQMLEEFAKRFDVWNSNLQFADDVDESELVEMRAAHDYAVLALLALGGRAMLLKSRGSIVAIEKYWNPIREMIGSSLPIDRFVPAFWDRMHGLHREWSRWEVAANRGNGMSVFYVQPERYPMVALLAQLLTERSSMALPPLGGHAQRMIEVWNGYRDLICAAGDVSGEEREEVSRAFIARLETSLTAEKRQREDRAIGARLDTARVSEFEKNVRDGRRADRALEQCFAQVARVRELDNESWQGRASLRAEGLVHRDTFTVGTDLVVPPGYGRDFGMRLESVLLADLVERLAIAPETTPRSADTLDSLLNAAQEALVQLGATHALIIAHGNVTSKLLTELRMRALDSSTREIGSIPDTPRRVLAAYKGHCGPSFLEMLFV